MAVIPPPALAERRAATPSGRPEGARRGGVNVMAVIAAITGVLLFPLSILPLCCGGIAMNQMRRTGQTGLIMAGIGIALGSIGSAIWVGFWIMVLLNKGVTIVLPSF